MVDFTQLSPGGAVVYTFTPDEGLPLHYRRLNYPLIIHVL